MRPRPSLPVLVGRGLLFFLVYPVGFAIGLVAVLQVVIALFEPPVRYFVAPIAFVAYIYAFGRWVLRLKTRPLLAQRTKQRLRKFFGRFGLTIGGTDGP